MTEYFLRGTFIRPPELRAPEITVDMSRLSIYAGQQSGPKTLRKRCPLVVAGAWKAPAGSVAIALASIASEPVQLAFELKPSAWGLRRGRMFLHTAEGAQHALGEFSGRAIPVTVTLPERGAAVLELVPADK